MIKVKDGYAKLIGTTYQGSATQVLLSNGGNLEFSSATKTNTLVQRNASQHIYATYFNSAISDEALTDIGSVYVRNTSDTFIRRISKTQFYSIIDNKFVTLDTAQTITGVKTFSTGPILANNATITQNQNSTSNYTTVVKWLKGGTSQGTYNPSIGQHNTGGDGTGSICILPYPTSTNPWGGIVGLFISKGVLRLDGKAVAIAENYYTKTESDGRYVGGKKAAGHGSSRTAYTADTYSSNFVNNAFVAYAERGSWAYANNGYVSTDVGVNIPLAGTAIFQWGASHTNKTQLYITPHNNSGVSNPAANEMLFYTSNGSGYTSAWTRVLTHRNYTAYTVTKTGGGASGTWGISITGNAATATTALYLASNSRMDYGWNGLNYFNFNGTKGNGTKVNDSPTSAWWHILRFNHGNAAGYYTDLAVPFNANSLYYKRIGNGALKNGGWVRILDELNYTSYVNPANYVTALGTSGNYVTWTKNGATNNLTVPYATKANRLTLVSCYNGTTNNDLWSTIKTANSTYIGTATIYEVYNDGGPTTYGEVLDIVSMHSNHWQPQLWFGSGKSGNIYYRNKDYNNNTWGAWQTILTNINYSATLDGRYVTLATTQTVSGVKTFSTQQKFTVATGTSPFTVSSTTVVSNLNSDLLDGYHAASFYQYGYVMFARTIDASGLSTSTYYPVTFSIGNHSNVRIECRVSLNSGTKPSWSTHTNGFSVRKIWEVNGHGYGTNPVNRRILVSDYAFANSDPVRGVGQLTRGSIEYVYVRGGGKYLFYISHNIGATLQTSTYTNNSQSVAPTTSAPAAISTPTLTFAAGKFSALSYKPITGVNTVYIPTNTSHLTNDSGFWTGTRYWANIAVSTSSSTSTSPTFSTAYTSDWFRSTGNTGWYSQTYGGGWNMTDTTYIRAYGSKRVYTANTEQYAFYTAGGMTAAKGFWHSAVNSNSYVLLAGGSYKGLGDFAKGNAGSATKGVYVTGGTVTAMTYSLSSNLNSGTSGKLAYYSSATTVAAYSSSVGSSAQPIYLNKGSLSASSYSFTGTYSNPVIVWCGEIYRNTPGSTYWYSVKKGGCCSIFFTTNNAGSNGNLIISIPHCEPYAAFCSTVSIFNGSTAISAKDGTITGRSAGMGDYMTICGVSGTTGNVYIRKFCQQNAHNDTWRNGELETTTTKDDNKPVARFYLMIVGRYI